MSIASHSPFTLPGPMAGALRLNNTVLPMPASKTANAAIKPVAKPAATASTFNDVTAKPAATAFNEVTAKPAATAFNEVTAKPAATAFNEVVYKDDDHHRSSSSVSEFDELSPHLSASPAPRNPPPTINAPAAMRAATDTSSALPLAPITTTVDAQPGAQSGVHDPGAFDGAQSTTQSNSCSNSIARGASSSADDDTYAALQLDFDDLDGSSQTTLPTASTASSATEITDAASATFNPYELPPPTAAAGALDYHTNLSMFNPVVSTGHGHTTESKLDPISPCAFGAAPSAHAPSHSSSAFFDPAGAAMSFLMPDPIALTSTGAVGGARADPLLCSPVATRNYAPTVIQSPERDRRVFASSDSKDLCILNSPQKDRLRPSASSSFHAKQAPDQAHWIASSITATAASALVPSIGYMHTRPDSPFSPVPLPLLSASELSAVDTGESVLQTDGKEGDLRPLDALDDMIALGVCPPRAPAPSSSSSSDAAAGESKKQNKSNKRAGADGAASAADASNKRTKSAAAGAGATSSASAVAGKSSKSAKSKKVKAARPLLPPSTTGFVGFYSAVHATNHTLAAAAGGGGGGILPAMAPGKKSKSAPTLSVFTATAAAATRPAFLFGSTATSGIGSAIGRAAVASVDSPNYTSDVGRIRKFEADVAATEPWLSLRKCASAESAPQMGRDGFTVCIALGGPVIEPGTALVEFRGRLRGYIRNQGLQELDGLKGGNPMLHVHVVPLSHQLGAYIDASDDTYNPVCYDTTNTGQQQSGSSIKWSNKFRAFMDERHFLWPPPVDKNAMGAKRAVLSSAEFVETADHRLFIVATRRILPTADIYVTFPDKYWYPTHVLSVQRHPTARHLLERFLPVYRFLCQYLYTHRSPKPGPALPTTAPPTGGAATGGAAPTQYDLMQLFYPQLVHFYTGYDATGTRLVMDPVLAASDAVETFVALISLLGLELSRSSPSMAVLVATPPSVVALDGSADARTIEQVRTWLNDGTTSTLPFVRAGTAAHGNAGAGGQPSQPTLVCRYSIGSATISSGEVAPAVGGYPYMAQRLFGAGANVGTSAPYGYYAAFDPRMMPRAPIPLAPVPVPVPSRTVLSIVPPAESTAASASGISGSQTPQTPTNAGASGASSVLAPQSPFQTVKLRMSYDSPRAASSSTPIGRKFSLPASASASSARSFSVVPNNHHYHHHPPQTLSYVRPGISAAPAAPAAPAAAMTVALSPRPPTFAPIAPIAQHRPGHHAPPPPQPYFYPFGTHQPLNRSTSGGVAAPAYAAATPIQFGAPPK